MADELGRWTVIVHGQGATSQMTAGGWVADGKPGHEAFVTLNGERVPNGAGIVPTRRKRSYLTPQGWVSGEEVL